VYAEESPQMIGGTFGLWMTLEGDDAGPHTRSLHVGNLRFA